MPFSHKLALRACLPIAVVALASSAKHAAAETVPMVMSGRTPMVMATVNGEGPFRFVIDPGNETLLDRELAERLGLLAEPGDGDTVLVPSLALAESELGPVEAGLWDASPMSPGSAAPDGILSLSLFADRLLTVDYGNRELVMEPGELAGSDGGEIVDYSLNEDGAVVVPITIAGIELAARMDVGVLASFTLPTDYIESLPLVAVPGRIGWTLTSDGERVEIVGSRLDGFARIGGHRIERPGLDFSQGYTEAYIGYDAVNHMAITFDQRNRRVRFAAELGHGEFLQSQAAAVPSLEDGAADLRTAFNRNPDHVRMIVMLSPT